MERKINYFLLLLLFFFPTHLLSQNWDKKTVINFNSHSFSKPAVYLYSQSIYPATFGLPTAGLAHGYLSRNEKLYVASTETIAALGLTYIHTNLLKLTFQRDRPYISIPEIQPYYQPSGFSFPSGHTSLAFSLATSISLNYPKWYYIVPSYLYAAGIGYSRINLGVHYPSDVIIGGIVGICSAILTHYILHRWNAKKYIPGMKRFTPKPISLYSDAY